MQQRHQVTNDRQIVQRHEVNTNGVGAATLECQHDGCGVRARGYKNGDRCLGVLGAQLADPLRDGCGFRLPVLTGKQAQLDGVGRDGDVVASQSSETGSERHRTGPQVIALGKQAAECAVGPLDELGDRAEIASQLQWLEVHTADS